MNNKSNNLIVGSVVLVSFAILIYGVYFMKDIRPGQKYDKYYVRFNQVSTLTEGDPVKINGVPLGKVETIELDKNKVRVTLKIKRGVTIPKDSRIRVQNIGLMGERQIGIILGDAKEVYPVGSSLPGLFDAGIAEVMGLGGEVFMQADDLVRTVKKVLDSTVAKPEFADNFNVALAQARELSDRANQLLRDLEPKLNGSLENLQLASTDIKNLVEEQKGPVAQLISDGHQVAEQLKSVVEKVDHLAGQLGETVDKMNSSQSTLGALIHDENFYRQLRNTLDNADSLFRQIKKQGLDVNVDLF